MILNCFKENAKIFQMINQEEREEFSRRRWESKDGRLASTFGTFGAEHDYISPK